MLKLKFRQDFEAGVLLYFAADVLVRSSRPFFGLTEAHLMYDKNCFIPAPCNLSTYCVGEGEKKWHFLGLCPKKGGGVQKS